MGGCLKSFLQCLESIWISGILVYVSINFVWLSKVTICLYSHGAIVLNIHCVSLTVVFDFSSFENNHTVATLSLVLWTSVRCVMCQSRVRKRALS